MFRFLIEGEEWILRFSPQIAVEDEEREVILQSILVMNKDISFFTHGQSFIMFDKKIGAIVFRIEKIPSLILTVCNIITDEHWFFR